MMVFQVQLAKKADVLPVTRDHMANWERAQRWLFQLHRGKPAPFCVELELLKNPTLSYWYDLIVQELNMRSVYLIEKVDDPAADSYWVQADSGDEARQMIAKNIPEAAEAEDEEKYTCRMSSTQTPPYGLIYRRLGGPVPIA